MTEKTEKHFKDEPFWSVEKFIPTACPKCRQEFKENGLNGFYIGTYWRHEAPEVSAKIRDSIRFPNLETDLIVCPKCENITVRVMTEERRFVTKREALECLENGFLNLRECLYTGPCSEYPAPRTTIFTSSKMATRFK